MISLGMGFVRALFAASCAASCVHLDCIEHCRAQCRAYGYYTLHDVMTVRCAKRRSDSAVQSDISLPAGHVEPWSWRALELETGMDCRGCMLGSKVESVRCTQIVGAVDEDGLGVVSWWEQEDGAAAEDMAE